MAQRVVSPPSTRAQGRLQQRAAVSTGEKAGLAVDRERLAQAVRELAADLATTRRDCRDKQRRIDVTPSGNRQAPRRRLGSDP